VNDLARKTFITNRHETSKRNIRASIQYLQQRLNQALNALEKGEHGLDENLITNANALTHDIALYNLTLDLKAFEGEHTK
jgi:hypothetical protein